MPEQEEILSALRTVKDPELNVNVVDLGLVYTVQSKDDQRRLCSTPSASRLLPKRSHRAGKAIENDHIQFADIDTQFERIG